MNYVQPKTRKINNMEDPEVDTYTKDLEVGMTKKIIYIYIYIYIWGTYACIFSAFNDILINISSNEKCVTKYDASASLWHIGKAYAC